MYYRINSPQIVHETIDGETIIIDFESGSYYSVREVANQIWTWIGEGTYVDQIVAQASNHYTGTQVEIESAVRAFIASLAEAALIVATEPSALPSTLVQTSGEAPFSPPILERYTDMQDLLLLDPIHEVDEQGWPQRK
jgi:hypothetical protein